MGLFQKWKLKYLKSIYFWNVQAERNNLIYRLSLNSLYSQLFKFSDPKEFETGKIIPLGVS